MFAQYSLPSQKQTNEKKTNNLTPSNFISCAFILRLLAIEPMFTAAPFRLYICNCRTVTVPVIFLFYHKVTSSDTAENFFLFPLLPSLSQSAFFSLSLLLRRSCLEILHLLLSMSAYYSTLILNTNFLCVVSFENCIYLLFFVRKAT